MVGGATSGGAMSVRCRLCTDSVASQFWKGAGVWYSAGSDGGRKWANGLIGKKACPGVRSGIAAAAAAAEPMYGESLAALRRAESCAAEVGGLRPYSEPKAAAAAAAAAIDGDGCAPAAMVGVEELSD